MLIEESKWLGEEISKINPQKISQLINIGSSTLKFRETYQPWINKYIFDKLISKKVKVIHLDIKKDRGVDVVGDLTKTRFLNYLKNFNVNSALCSNFLEHVSNKEEIAESIVNLIPVGGLIFVSVPFRYPYHADPIDNKFRPNLLELSKLFPNTKIIKGKIVISGTYLNYITISPFMFLKMIIRLLFPFYKFSGWKTTIYHVPWLFRNFSATCLILKKTSEPKRE